ncbi:MAG TPA: phospholipase [Roseiflexaceae bacterium]|nr:phospholipase [Roseiflexaceae bacterium]
MQHKPLSLTHILQRPRRPSEDRPPLLFVLHGYGSNEHDLIGLAPYLDPRFQIVSARAPHTLMPGGYAWFELGWTATDIVINHEQAEQSRALLLEFIAEALAAYGGDPARVYLLGFSQGAIMSASVALSQPELIAGTVLMSGRVPAEIRPLIAPPERLAGKPFLVVHGTADTVLPIQNGRASRALLADLPVDLTYKEYSMAHEVSAQSLADVTAWLATHLDRQ